MSSVILENAIPALEKPNARIHPADWIVTQVIRKAIETVTELIFNYHIESIVCWFTTVMW